MSRTVCVVTGTRAEFGLLRWLMAAIDSAPELSLQVVATGMHLAPEFGYTYKEIEEAGFKIDARVEMLLSSDSSSAVTKSLGLGLIGFADAYERLAPDLLVVLGDRFEILAAASAAMIAGIPIAHLHGGETTEGAFDEAIRHSITKMSHLHFVAADEYRQRVIQLGESPDRVFNVGGMGVDAIQRLQLLSREELEHVLNFRFYERNLLVTFHPVTLEGSVDSANQMQELLSALSKMQDAGLIFTLPNADTGGRELGAMLQKFAAEYANAKLFTSLGQLRYFSCLAQVDAVVGNSSSGLTEAPSFNIGTINIGDRQKGRLKASSVIDCKANCVDIQNAIEQLYSNEFRSRLKKTDKPYGSGNSVERIIEVLSQENLSNLIKKEFYDI